MGIPARSTLLALLSLAFSGCSVAMYGNQSTSGGTTVTTTSTQVSASAHGANFRASFSSGGRPVSPKAPGGTVYASGSAAYVVVGVVALADLWNYFLGAPQPKPLAPGTAISHTCSCYGYKPPAPGEEAAQ
jgi:zona occludens toxin (predicted ATPase)